MKADMMKNKNKAGQNDFEVAVPGQKKKRTEWS
jgi:hypothetical protein